MCAVNLTAMEADPVASRELSLFLIFRFARLG